MEGETYLPRVSSIVFPYAHEKYDGMASSNGQPPVVLAAFTSRQERHLAEAELNHGKVWWKHYGSSIEPAD